MGILGISLGTTTIGIAYINDRELAEYNTHSFREVWSDKKADTIIHRIGAYLLKYKIHIIVVKVPPATHQPVTIKELISKITSLCAYHGCMMNVCTKQQLKEHIPGAKNNADVMDYVVSLYPVTLQQYTDAKARKNHYHKKLFEAVAAAHIEKIKGG